MGQKTSQRVLCLVDRPELLRTPWNPSKQVTTKLPWNSPIAGRLNLSFSVLQRAVTQVCQNNQPVVCLELSGLRHVFRKHVKPKKQHEMCRLARWICIQLTNTDNHALQGWLTALEKVKSLSASSTLGPGLDTSQDISPTITDSRFCSNLELPRVEF